MRLIILRLSPGFWLFWKFWGETTRHFSTLRKRVRGSDRGSYATEKHGRSQFRESIMGGAGSPGSPGSPFLFQGRGPFWSKTWQKNLVMKVDQSLDVPLIWVILSGNPHPHRTFVRRFSPFPPSGLSDLRLPGQLWSKKHQLYPHLQGERPDFLVNNNFSWLKPIYHMVHTFTPLFNGSNKTHTYCLKTIDQMVNSPSNAHQWVMFEESSRSGWSVH